MLTPEQWRRIERLFESVEDAPPSERARILRESGEEDSVRFEVLRMLDASGSGLLDVNLRAKLAAPSHAPGEILAGRFRIDGLIAEGGMGEVYKAFDTELQIPVALKSIHRMLARDNFAIERFKQEVQLARKINHPNVCRIYDLQKHQNAGGGADEYFLTMELLDGETLRALLDRKKHLSEEEAAAILTPLLDALQASHEHGVLHLDLKPSNIHLSTDNNNIRRVVVTDFGLATSSYQSPTENNTVSAGTPAYMAPEQFDRKPATPATDIYAAGVMLYEMLCGKLPFTARTPADMHEQKQLNQRIPARQLMPSLSKRMENVLERTIQPDPSLRYPSAAAMRLAINPKRVTMAGWAAIAAGLAALTLGGLWWTNRLPTGSPVPIRKLTADSGYSMEPALAPDGQTVVYSSDRGANGMRALWRVQPGGSPVQLTFEEVDASQPDVSPDGKWIAYRSERDGGGVYIIPFAGSEAPRVIAPGGERPRFSPDGQWILYMAKPATTSQMPQVFAVSVSGAKSAHVSEGFRDAHNPIWAPDGKSVLFCGTRTPGVPSEEHDWWQVQFPPGEARKTGIAVEISKSSPASSPVRLNEDLAGWVGDYVYYVSPQTETSAIWRVKYRSGMTGLIEPPQRLTYGSSFDLQPSIVGNRMVFASSTSNIDIWSLPLFANTGVRSGEPERVTDNMDFEVSPSPNPVTRDVLFTRAMGSMRQIRWLPEGGGLGAEAKPWSEPSETADQAVWSPDGQWAAFRVLHKPKIRIYMRNRAGESRLICQDCGGPTDWSPDQRYILYEPGAKIAFVGRLDIASGDWTELIKHPLHSLRAARYSPDGKWVAFQAEPTTTERRVYIAPNEPQINEDKWIAIGGDSGRSPVDFLPSWSPDGNLLYFISQRDGFRCIWAQKLDPATKRPVGAPFEVQHFHRSRRTLLRILNSRAGQIGFRVARDHAYFSMDEVTGNLWSADLPK